MRGQRLTITTLTQRAWCDKDEALLHAAFQILTNFVEEEKPQERLHFASHAWTGTSPTAAEREDYPNEPWEEHIAAWSQLFALYHWWKDVRPVRFEAYDSPRAPFPAEVLALPLPDDNSIAEPYRGAKTLGDLPSKVWGVYLDLAYYYEDTRKLQELTALRTHLWI